MATNVVTTASTSTTVCNYAPNVLTANPGPPASGSSFAVAKAINGAPYARSGKSAGVFQGGQGYVRANGFGTATISRSSVAETGEAIPLGAGWPVGSSIEFWYNPVFSGRGSTQSSISPIYQYSSASVQERIESGAGVSTEIYYQNLWDLSMTNSSGVGQASPTWYFPGASSGFYYRQVPVTIAGTYRFTIRSTTTVSATPAIGAGAAADMDFGSDVLDTPANLSPYWFGIMPNANGATGQPYSHVTIAYILPAGWGTSC